jgi:hypothetical protein
MVTGVTFLTTMHAHHLMSKRTFMRREQVLNTNNFQKSVNPAGNKNHRHY